MLFLTLCFSFVFALLFAALIRYVFNRKGPGPLDGFLFFTLIIFMFSWAIGGWIAPFGPIHFGVNWLSYLSLAFVVMLFLGVLLPPQKPPYKAENRPVSDFELLEKNAATYPLGITFGFFFWIMITTLLVFVIVKLFFQIG